MATVFAGRSPKPCSRGSNPLRPAMTHRIRDTRNDESARNEIEAERELDKAIHAIAYDSVTPRKQVGGIVKRYTNKEKIKHLRSQTTQGRTDTFLETKHDTARRNPRKK